MGPSNNETVYTGAALAVALLAADPLPVIAVDEAGLVREFNHAAEQLYRMRSSQVVGQSALKLLVPARNHHLFREAMATYRATGDDSAFGSRLRMKIRRADGSEPLVEFTPLPVRVAGELLFVTYVHGVLAGNSDRQPEPAESDVRFGLVAELAPVGIVLADIGGRCTYVNSRWCKLIGLPAAEALHRQWLDAVHPEDVTSLRARLATVMASGQELRADCRLTSSDGSETWVHVVVRPIRSPDGSYLDQMAAFTNVDARKRAEADREAAHLWLTEQNSKLRDIDAAKTAFLGTVSHELRSPLTSIVSFTQLLLDDAATLPPDAVEYLGIIERNAERLLRMVNDLLYLDRLAEGAVSLELAPVSVPEVAADSVLAESPAAQSAKVRLELHGGDGPKIEADKVRLHQVLDNLISNAVKFSEPGSRVDVAACWDGSEWLVSVRDQGIGIPAGELRQLFGRFFRASNAVTRQVPGSGIGLATAKALTELHGGHIDVASAEGEGTTMTVHLPARR